MGLILSTLIFCVGVIELLTFYHNVRRRVEYPPARGNLTHIRASYIQELRSIRRQLIDDLEKLNAASKQDSSHEVKSPTHEHNALNSIPTFRLNSHEDIEIEYSENITRSKSPSPRRFLVTEREHCNKTSERRRRFVVAEEEPTLRKSKSQSSLPEFWIREETNFEKSPSSPRYVLQERQGTHECPIPLPTQFIVSEAEFNTVVFEDSIGSSENSKVEYIKRSPSPFPLLEDAEVHTNNVSDDLNACSSLDSVQEEQKSRSSSPNTVIENIPRQSCLRPLVSQRIRSKSESDSSCIQINSNLSGASQIQSKIESELEEALNENALVNETCGFTKITNIDGDSREIIGRTNVSNSALGIISETYRQNTA